MNITYLDADTREVIDIVDDPASVISEAGAAVVKILPTPYENE